MTGNKNKKRNEICSNRILTEVTGDPGPEQGFSPRFPEICCINEINCRLLQKRNRKAPGYGMRITEIKKTGIWHADERPENREVRGRTIRFPENWGDWHKNCS